MRPTALAALAIFFLAAAPARADDGALPPAEKLELYAGDAAPAACKPGATVVVNLQGVDMRVPRAADVFVTVGKSRRQQTLDKPGDGFDCSTARIADVSGLVIDGMMLGDVGNKPAARRHFDDERNTVNAILAGKMGKKEDLPDGVAKLTYEGYHVEDYVLPQKAAPTYDKVQAVFSCLASDIGWMLRIAPQTCEELYMHPMGFRVTYQVMRSDIKENQFIEADRKHRKIIDDMIKAAKQPSPD